MSKWVAYVIRSETHGYTYVGITTNMDKRLAEHNAGTGAKFTRGRGPWVLVGTRPAGDSRSSAQRLERHWKSLRRRDLVNMLSPRV